MKCKLVKFLPVAFLSLCCGMLPVGCNKKAAHETEMQVCADTLLLAADAAGDVACPLTVDEDVVLDSVAVDKSDTLLYLSVTVDEDLVDTANVAYSHDFHRFMLGLVKADKTVDRLLMLASRVPLGVRMDLKSASGTALGAFELASADFAAMQVDVPGLRERDELKVFNRVRADNASCPFEIEDGFTIVSMSVQDRYVTFRTEMDVEKIDFSVLKENRDSVNHAVVESLRLQLQDSLQRKSLLDISDARLGYRNRYIASDRSDSFDISFTPSDLARLIAVTDSLAGQTRKNAK